MHSSCLIVHSSFLIVHSLIVRSLAHRSFAHRSFPPGSPVTLLITSSCCALIAVFSWPHLRSLMIYSCYPRCPHHVLLAGWLFGLAGSSVAHGTLMEYSWSITAHGVADKWSHVLSW